MRWRLASAVLGLALGACGEEVDCLAICEANFDRLASLFGVPRPCLEAQSFELADTCFECEAVFSELYFAPIEALETEGACRED